jgi:aldehyde dehydrogenase (NAD+)
MGELVQVFDTSYKARLSRLSRLEEAISRYEEAIQDALLEDLCKSPEDTYLGEIGYLYGEIRQAKRGLKRWMKPKRVSTPLVLWPASSRIVSVPRGKVLIIAPWNYPFQLALAPAIGAIAAGNRVVIKPSEHSPNTAQVIQKICADAFSPNEVDVVLGGVEETSELLSKEWGLIFFTGGTGIGKIIMGKASQTLSPVVLELGGKSPCLVAECQNIKVAAKRIAWGKYLNAGQICVAPDYLLIHEAQYEQFMEAFKESVAELYGPRPLECAHYGKIINGAHLERLSRLINPDEVSLGGGIDRATLKIEPTAVKADLTHPLMKEEIFGPILPVITYSALEEAYELIRRYPNPLAAYVFSDSSAVTEEFQRRIVSGGLCINDVLVQLTNKNLPFGGVGTSGMGNYHGKHSFNTFSHQQAVLKRSLFAENNLRYPPFGNRLGLLKWVLRWFG